MATKRISDRRRTVLTVTVVALVVAGTTAVVLVDARDGPRRDSTDLTADTIASPGTEPPPESTRTLPATDTSAITEPFPAPDTIALASATTLAPGVDPADEYLTDTTVIYERTMPDGRVVAARISTLPYASVFGIEWRAPTGSAQRCLGDRAVFLGEPGVVGPWGSAWVTNHWYDLPAPDSTEVTLTMSSADGLSQYVLVRTPLDSREVVVNSADGTFTDSAAVVEGVAILVVPIDLLGLEPRVSVVEQSGERSEASPLMYGMGGSDRPECSPGDQPPVPLPDPGPQPADPSAAEAQIRQRHALLVDRSIPRDAKPPDLLDDDTGVQDAIEQVDAGQYAESAAGATFAIDELVFTSADMAWFRYTITAPTGTFGDRFGTATFNGRVWQITRETICQDLSLASGTCRPAASSIEPPRSEQWQAEWEEWMDRANLYNFGDGCQPLSQC